MIVPPFIFGDHLQILKLDLRNFVNLHVVEIDKGQSRVVRFLILRRFFRVVRVMGLFFFVFIAITVEEAADGPDDTFEEATALLFCCHTIAIDASGRLWTAEEAAAFGDNGLRGSTVSHVDVAPNVDLTSADNFWVEWSIWVD